MKHFSLRYVLPTVTVFAVVVWAAALSIPNAFEAGNVIRAAEMNENFTAVATAVSALEAQAEALASQIEALEAQVVLPGYEGFFAYAWVNLPEGTPEGNYSFHPTGQIDVSNSAAGVYLVSFGDDSPRIRNVQVTAYGSSSTHCKVGSWTDHAVTVRCFDAAGAPVDSLFTIWVTS